MFGFLKQRNEKWVKARLSLYMDGRLSVGDEAKVESHLKDCQACRDELASLRATVEALRQLPLVSPPRSFTIPALKLSPRPVTFYRMRLATVVVSMLLVAVIAGDSLGMFFKPEAPQPLMAPAPAAMPAPRAPAVPQPTIAVTPAPTSQDYSAAAGKAAPSIVITPTPSVAPLQMQPAPAGREGAPGKAGIAGVPAPTPIGTPTPPQKALPVGPTAPAGPRGMTAESLAEATQAAAPPTPPTATPTPQPSPAPEEQFKAETVQPTPEPPTPPQAPPQAPDYLWPVRQFELALVAIILILIMATTLIWLRGKK